MNSRQMRRLAGSKRWTGEASGEQELGRNIEDGLLSNYISTTGHRPERGGNGVRKKGLVETLTSPTHPD